jgi:hypothetical protein
MSKLSIEIRNNIGAAVEASIYVYTKKSKPIMNAAYEQILTNMERRYLDVFSGVGSRKGMNIPASVRAASKITFNPDGVIMTIADKDRLDNITRLSPTVSEGKVYSLFSLLREGWGRRGGKRPDDYILYMITSTVGYNQKNTGRVAPYPDLVNRVRRGIPVGGSREGYILPAIGRIFVFAKHPGFKGYDWIQKAAGENFAEDRKVFRDAVERISLMATKAFNKKHSKFVTITRGTKGR